MYLYGRELCEGRRTWLCGECSCVERNVAVQRSVRVCSCVENIWRMCGECNCVKIDVTMSRGVWLCSREMYVCTGRHVTMWRQRSSERFFKMK